MELKLLEKSPQKLKLEVAGETHTLLNLLTEYAWVEKASQALYIIEHPYMSQPKLIVGSANPKKTLDNAVQMVIDQSKDFRKAFERSLKK